MNKKSIDKIEILALDFNYESFFKDIYNINSLKEFIDFISNDIDKVIENIYTYDRFLEYSWYVYMDEIIIKKDIFINFYINILKKVYNKDVSIKKFEEIYNNNIKLYIKEKNNINYHKIILDTI
jgi:hypothetical protein